MTKTELKHKAQDELLHGMQVAFERTDDEELIGLMDKQMARVEKMFGYKPGTFSRGC